MSENINEIINDLQRVADRKCYPEDILCGSIAQEWADYIADLYEENERLNNIIKTKDEGIKALTEDLCETAEENENLKEAIETIKRTNLLLIKQKAESEDNLYMLDERIDKAIEEITKNKYMIDIGKVLNILKGL